jgi:hypothetical protein
MQAGLLRALYFSLLAGSLQWLGPSPAKPCCCGPSSGGQPLAALLGLLPLVAAWVVWQGLQLFITRQRLALLQDAAQPEALPAGVHHVDM